MDDLWTILRSGMWRLWYKLSREGKTRFYDEFLPLLHDTKHDVMGTRDDDSYYLVYLGSKPSARGKGYAKKLIEHMLVRVSVSYSTSTHPSSGSGSGPVMSSDRYQKTSLERNKNLWRRSSVKPKDSLLTVCAWGMYRLIKKTKPPILSPAPMAISNTIPDLVSRKSVISSLSALLSLSNCISWFVNRRVSRWPKARRGGRLRRQFRFVLFEV
jgi:GNAT superfamily N-acetyltransferase